MEQKRPSVRRPPAAGEEAKAWASFYRNAADPEIAAALVAHMDKDAECRATHAGLYLRCKLSLRRQRARQARIQRYGNAIRLVLRLALLGPATLVAHALHRLVSALSFGGDVVLDLCNDGAGKVTSEKASFAPAGTHSPASGPAMADNDTHQAPADPARTV